MPTRPVAGTGRTQARKRGQTKANVRWELIGHLQSNKARLAKWVEFNCGVKLDTEMLFDIQVRRL